MAYLGGLLNFFRAIPPPLLVPVFLVTLGLDRMAYGTIAFGAIWPVLLNTVDGARGVDATKVDTASAFRLSRAQWFLGVVLPSALPKIFAGLRLSISIALILMVVSELVGSTNGIGNQLIGAQRDYDLPATWAWIILLSAIGYVLNTVLLIGERRALRWQNTLGGTA
jgi:ABC-type nitrate/sulfonate/bicarbonate transport system permease component